MTARTRRTMFGDPDTRGDPASGHERARGWALVVLVAVALTAGAVVEGAPRDAVAALGYGSALLWIPAVGVVRAILARDPARPWLRLAAVATEWTLPLAALVIVPELVVLVALLQLPLTAHHAHVDPHRSGPLAAALSLAVVGAGAATTALAAGWVAVYALVVAGMVWPHVAAGRQRAEAEHRVAVEQGRSEALLTGVAEAVVVTLHDGRILRFNRASERTFGCPSRDAVGASCSDVLGLRHGVTVLDCARGCAILAEQQRTGGDVEVWRRRQNGERQPLLASALPLDDGERRLEVVHSFRDITRLKEAEEAKTLFLASASHELKTPLTVIGGFAELLLNREDIDEELRITALQAVVARTWQLSGVVDRILLTSRIDAGRITVDVRPVQLGAPLRDRVRALSAASSRDVAVSVPEGLPPARVDPDAFITVIDHLLDNAVKYSPGGETVEVAAVARPEHVDVTVRDQGIGMTEEQREHCFDQFWQAESGTTRRFGGSGIGLYVVRSLVEAMHGTVAVEGMETGTRFTVSLPRADVDTSDGHVDAQHGTDSIVVEFMHQVGLLEREATP